jgi:DNA-binding transcriptional regulator LsrR (DeoR family)
MHDGMSMNADELRQAASDAVAASEHTQTQVAEELDVTRGAISRALNEASTSLATLQGKIIHHLTGFQIERQVDVHFVAHEAEK